MGEHFYQDSSGHWQYGGDSGSANSPYVGFSLIPTLKVGDAASENSSAWYANSLNLVDIYKHSADSVVLINGNRQTTKGLMDVSGSGFFLTSDGVIATDLHVVQDTKNLTVTTASGEKLKATIIDEEPAIDGALLQVDASAGETFQPVAVGDSTHLPPGSSVVAIGHPQGWSEEFASEGQVTRHTTMAAEAAEIKGGLQPGEDPNRSIVKSSMHVEPGSSGSALFDEKTGAVVGMVDTANPVKAESTPIEDVMTMLYRTRGIQQDNHRSLASSPMLKSDEAVRHHSLEGITAGLQSRQDTSQPSPSLSSFWSNKPNARPKAADLSWLQKAEDYAASTISRFKCAYLSSCG